MSEELNSIQIDMLRLVSQADQLHASWETMRRMLETQNRIVDIAIDVLVELGCDADLSVDRRRKCANALATMRLTAKQNW